jgi:hypothetical protein
LPPCSSSFIAITVPGYGAANATLALPLPLCVYMVVKRLSPVITRLPADSSLSMKPPDWPLAEPSPNTVSICTALSLNISEPASAMADSPGSSSISTNCISWPWMRKSISSARPFPPLRGGGGGAGAASPGTPSTSSAMLRTGSQSPMPSFQASSDGLRAAAARAASVSIGPRRWLLVVSCRCHWLIANSVAGGMARSLSRAR